MDKIPVKFSGTIAPYCPQCGSGEYLTNEDGNQNEYCGQCGIHLDWEHAENEDTEQTENIKQSQNKYKCKNCKYYTTRAVGKRAEIGDCKKKPEKNPIYANKQICAKFAKRFTEV